MPASTCEWKSYAGLYCFANEYNNEPYYELIVRHSHPGYLLAEEKRYVRVKKIANN
jgi:hypothetical protein